MPDVLEVVLITAGVFLGLAGESWRETREHRELAGQSLRRFREEIKTYRAAVLRVHQRHKDQAKGMNDYFNANGPALMAAMLVAGIGRLLRRYGTARAAVVAALREASATAR